MFGSKSFTRILENSREERKKKEEEKRMGVNEVESSIG